MDNKLTVFRIGQIVNTQGLKGEVRVYPYTDEREIISWWPNQSTST